MGSSQILTKKRDFLNTNIAYKIPTGRYTRITHHGQKKKIQNWIVDRTWVPYVTDKGNGTKSDGP